VLAVLAGKLTAGRESCAALAGKSTLPRLELSGAEPMRYHKIVYDAAVIEALPMTLFLEAHKRPPRQIILDLDATDDGQARVMKPPGTPKMLIDCVRGAAWLVDRVAPLDQANRNCLNSPLLNSGT